MRHGTHSLPAVWSDYPGELQRVLSVSVRKTALRQYSALYDASERCLRARPARKQIALHCGLCAVGGKTLHQGPEAWIAAQGSEVGIVLESGVQHDIAGLDVTVIDAFAMSFLQSFGNLTGDA